MAKVDWINWKTEKEDIINPTKIIDEISDSFQDYTCYMNAVIYEELNHEVQIGGLDKSSLNIMGTSPANESAIHILSQIEEIKEIIGQLKNNVQKELEEQKQTEKEQLIESIEVKIQEEEKKLKNTLLLKEKINSQNTYIKLQEVMDIIDITKDRITKLKERLEIAKSI